jgi:hypothetical protein
VATAVVLPLLSEKPHSPKLGAYPKYGDFPLLYILVRMPVFYCSMTEVGMA